MKKITFFETNADDRYAGVQFDLIPVKFDYESGMWIEAKESDNWGIYAPGIGLSAFTHDPSEFGVITEG